MAEKIQHVVPRGDSGAVKGASNKRATSVHDTQCDAIGAGRRI